MDNFMNEMMMNMIGMGCCVVATNPEEMQVLMNAVADYNQKEKTTVPTQEQARAIAAGVLVHLLNGLVEELENLGYDICVLNEGTNDCDSDYYWSSAELDVENKRVLI